MPKLIVCKDGQELIGIGEALRRRDEAITVKAEAPYFKCSNEHRVYAHRKGTTGQAAHFEHVRGQSCRSEFLEA